MFMCAYSRNSVLASSDFALPDTDISHVRTVCGVKVLDGYIAGIGTEL